MSFNVGQIASIIHQIAPPELAEDWDNVGLQIGSVDWEVGKVWISLDPLLHIVELACCENVDLLITHHPLFFENLSRINTDTAQGKLIDLALRKKLAIFCAHTNLDSAVGGVNDVLAHKIGLIDTKVLKKRDTDNFYKLVVFVPEGSEETVSDALFSAGAGQIGTYSCCSFRSRGKGTFRPGIKSTPSVGSYGLLSKVGELRIESTVHRQKLEDVIKSVTLAHPYETVPYDIYPIVGDRKSGIGRIGKLKTRVPLSKLVKLIKSALSLDTIKVSGNLDMIIGSVAVCSGSGSSLLQHFFASEAQVYVSSGITYHSARKADDLGLSIIDIGHFNSEKIVLEDLSKRIKKSLNEIGKNIVVSVANTESDVFKFL